MPPYWTTESVGLDACKSFPTAVMEVDGPSRPKVGLTEAGVLTALVSTLEANGTMLLTDLGGLLGKILGPEVTTFVKKELHGLRNLLTKHKELFAVTGKAPLYQVKLQQLTNSVEQPKPLPTTVQSAPITTSQASISSSAPSTTLAKYISNIKANIQKENWREVSKLLRVRNSPTSASFPKIASFSPNQDTVLDSKSRKAVSEALGDHENIDWAQLVSSHILVCIHYYNGNYKAAVTNQIEVTKCFDIYWKQNSGPTPTKTPAGGDIMMVWRVVLTEARLIAIWADMSLESLGQEANLLIVLQNHLRSLGKPLERTSSLLLLQNTILRIYSHSNTTSNFNTVLKVMQNQDISSPPFPICDVVTWNFFMGRYHLYQGDYTNALDLLSKAFSRCSSKYARNKQTILTYLLPVYAMMGTYPKKKLLERYQLMEYYDILEGVKHGNFQLYQDSMDKFERAIDRGVYLPLRRLTTVLFRNLFKRISSILGSMQTPPVAHPPKLPMSALHAGLQVSGYTTTPEETECIVTNLVATKKIRAYISHEHQVLVLAKSDIFPKLSTMKN